MDIPEITANQLRILTEVTKGLPTFTMVVPDATEDKPMPYERYLQSNNDVDALVVLGMLENISEECKEELATFKAFNGRNFRVFRVTNLGLQMFLSTTSKLVN